MKSEEERPTEALERIFHEPSRLAIVSALCAAGDSLTFSQLKESCGLTDGNLNRHLKTLEEAGTIRIRKRFVAARPCTSVQLTRLGLERFRLYLDALEEVLQQAREALPATREQGAAAGGRTAGAHAV